MFVIKDDDRKNDYKSYKSIYFNYFLICSNRVKLFLAMQVRVMAACMESQCNISSAQSMPRDGRGVSDVCGEQLHWYQAAHLWQHADNIKNLCLSPNLIFHGKHRIAQNLHACKCS